jgi:hypothetical protein
MLRANTSFLKVVHILGTDHEVKVEDMRLLRFWFNSTEAERWGIGSEEFFWF